MVALANDESNLRFSVSASVRDRFDGVMNGFLDTETMKVDVVCVSVLVFLSKYGGTCCSMEPCHLVFVVMALL